MWQGIDLEYTKLPYFVSTIEGLLINFGGATASPWEYKSTSVIQRE